MWSQERVGSSGGEPEKCVCARACLSFQPGKGRVQVLLRHQKPFLSQIWNSRSLSQLDFTTLGLSLSLPRRLAVRMVSKGSSPSHANPPNLALYTHEGVG